MKTSRRSSNYYRSPRRKWVTILLILVAVGIFIYPLRHLLIINFYLYQGKRQMTKGEYTSALRSLQKAVTINPQNALAHDALGMAYSYLDRGEEAEKEYQSALQLETKYHRWFDHVTSGDLLLARGKYPSAQIEYQQATQLQKNRAAAYFGLGATYHALGDFPQAINLYRKSLTLEPDFTSARQSLEIAIEERKEGKTHYLFDRNGEVLATRIHRQSRYYYPYGLITAHPLGFSNPQIGSQGLEKELTPFRMGNKIYLTLDCHWQAIASRALGSYRGAVIILHPKTGEILALLSQPAFNPNYLDKDWTKIQNNPNKVLLDRGLEKTYPAGSLFHIVTLAAALESRKDFSKLFPSQCQGQLNEKAHGEIKNLEEAFTQACNITFAKIAASLGPKLLSEYIIRLGWETPIEFPLPIANNVIPLTDLTLLIQTAGELEKQCQLTPLTAALIAGTIANNGVTMQPYLIKEIKNIIGHTFRAENPRILKQALKPETAQQIKELMVAAVDSGDSRQAKTEKVTLAGRTATVTIENESVGWFIGFAPAENPSIAFAIVVEKGTAYTAAIVARRIVEFLF